MPLFRQAAIDDDGSNASFKSALSDESESTTSLAAANAAATLTRISTSRLDFTVPRLGQHPDLVTGGGAAAFNVERVGSGGRLEADTRLRHHAVEARRSSRGLSRSDPEINAIAERHGKRPGAVGMLGAELRPEMAHARSGVSLNKGAPTPPTRRQDWQAKARTPADILQTHVLKEKMKDLKELMGMLKFFTLTIAEEDFDPENDELADEVERRFINTVIKIREVITGMFANLEILCNGRMSVKQAKFFAKIRSKVNPALDISVQYFGLDWKAMDSLMQVTVDHIISFSQQFLTNSAEIQNFSMRYPSHLVRDFNKILEDVYSHSDAVLNGRINRQGREAMRQKQNEHRNLLLRLKSEDDEDAAAAGPSSTKVVGSRLRQFFNRKRSAISRLGRARRRRSGSGRPADAAQNAVEGEDGGTKRSRRKEDVDLLWSTWYHSVQNCGNIAVAVQQMQIEESKT